MQIHIPYKVGTGFKNTGKVVECSCNQVIVSWLCLNGASFPFTSKDEARLTTRGQQSQQFKNNISQCRNLETSTFAMAAFQSCFPLKMCGAIWSRKYDNGDNSLLSHWMGLVFPLSKPQLRYSDKHVPVPTFLKHVAGIVFRVSVYFPKKTSFIHPKKYLSIWTLIIFLVYSVEYIPPIFKAENSIIEYADDHYQPDYKQR